ncbi:ATP-binding cassette domain-containing protein [Paenibacillus rhizoplanae]
MLALVGLADKRNSLVTTFSKGMRQRVLFAQALLAKPPLLIMDEPTNGLDPFWMNEFVKLLQNIREEGHTVLFFHSSAGDCGSGGRSDCLLESGQACGVRHYGRDPGRIRFAVCRLSP